MATAPAEVHWSPRTGERRVSSGSFHSRRRPGPSTRVRRTAAGTSAGAVAHNLGRNRCQMSSDPALDSMKQRNSPPAPTQSEFGPDAERQPSFAQLVAVWQTPRSAVIRTLLARRSPLKTVLVRSSAGSQPTTAWFGWSLSPAGNRQSLVIVMESCVKSLCSCAACVGRFLEFGTSMRSNCTLEGMDGTPICSLIATYRRGRLTERGGRDSWIFADPRCEGPEAHQCRTLGKWERIWPNTSPKQTTKDVVWADIDTSGLRVSHGPKLKQIWSSPTLFDSAGID